MEAAGFTAGASGDPHHFEAKKDPRTGQKEITWGVANCDSDAAVLMEYPVYVRRLLSFVSSTKYKLRLF